MALLLFAVVLIYPSFVKDIIFKVQLFIGTYFGVGRGNGEQDMVGIWKHFIISEPSIDSANWICLYLNSS